MKKQACIFAIAVFSFCLSFSAFNTESYAAAVSAYVYNTQDNLQESFGDYARNLYMVTQRPDLDEYVYEAFDLYEQNKDKSDKLKVFTGTKDSCKELQNYINYNYGYTADLNVEMYHVLTDDTYYLSFEDTLNAEEIMAEYKAESQRAKSVAALLKGDSADSTINNILNWIETFVVYDYASADNPTTETRYGMYSGKKVLCSGFAIAVYQLCSMNGIPATIQFGYYDGVFHAFNTVTYSDCVRYVDTASPALQPSVSLWDGITLTASPLLY